MSPLVRDLRRAVNRSGVACDSTDDGPEVRGVVVTDREQVDSVCRAEFPRLIGLIVMQVGDRHIAEELAQDALAAMIRKWDRIDRPEAWLTRVALNLSRSWLRRRIAERRAYRRHGPLDPTSPEVDVASTMDLVPLVAALPPRQRIAVTLRFYEQYSVDETAEAMGCAPGTVKALTHKAMTTLRAALPTIESEVDRHA